MPLLIFLRDLVASIVALYIGAAVILFFVGFYDRWSDSFLLARDCRVSREFSTAAPSYKWGCFLGKMEKDTPYEDD